MRKLRQNLVRIVNPITDKKLTSLSRAQEYVRRGRATWTVFGESIRFVQQAEVCYEARMERERSADAAYWNSIVRERKGVPALHEMHYMIGIGRSGGVSIVQFTPCLAQK